MYNVKDRTNLGIMQLKKSKTMKRLTTAVIFILGSFTSSVAQTETLIASDNVETWDWFGAWWTPAATAGYFSNISVSPSFSAVLFGSGNNQREQDWYVLPSRSVDISKEHIFKMRLAAQTISSPNSNTAGLDVGDYIEVQVSLDGGSYSREIRVSGYSNATWDYSSNAVAVKVANGSLTTFTPSGGGDRTNLGDGFSYIELVIPAGYSSIAIDIYTRANRAGEDWWMDNFELFELTPNLLPVELTSFQANCISNKNTEVSWSTASEYNASHFTVERSISSADEWVFVQEINANGFSQVESHYSIEDSNSGLNRTKHYRLRQFDYDGSLNDERIISVDCSNLGYLENIVLYPNPGNGNVSIQFFSPEKDENSLISISDLRGNILSTIPLSVAKGSNQIFFDISNLTSGVYMVKIIGTNFRSTTHKYVKKNI